jgi:hypothetical protein
MPWTAMTPQAMVQDMKARYEAPLLQAVPPSAQDRSKGDA